MKRLRDVYQTSYHQYKTQLFAAAVACFSGISVGTVGAYVSPAMNAIQHRYLLSEQETSVVASISFFGSIFGSLAAGVVSDHFGRKPALILAVTICVIGWLVLLCAKFVAILYAGRIIQGFSTAIISTAAPVYVTEIASAEIRGALGSCYILFVGIGVLYVNVVGAFVSWRYLAVACMSLPAIQVILVILLPETPTWLMRQHHEEDAVNAMKWLKRSDSLFELANNHNSNSERMSVKSFLSSAVLKPLAIVGMLMLITQFCGVGAVIVYSVSIFSSATHAIDPNLSAIIVAGSLVISHVFTFFLVDRVGRRRLLLISGLIMAVGMTAMGTYDYLQHNNINSVTSIIWLPVTSIAIFVLAYGMGFGPIPWLMMGELFPNRERGVASSIITTFNWTLTLVTTKTYVDMQAAMHDYGLFWLYGAVSLFGVLFTYCFVPETKGMAISEIERKFQDSNQSDATKS